MFLEGEREYVAPRERTYSLPRVLHQARSIKIAMYNRCSAPAAGVGRRPEEFSTGGCDNFEKIYTSGPIIDETSVIYRYIYIFIYAVREWD